MYKCKICAHKSASLTLYGKHHRIHSNYHKIPCGILKCDRSFKTFSSFKCHLTRDHSTLQNNNKILKLQNVGFVTHCLLPGCQMECSLNTLISHLKKHIDEGFEIQCPVAGCSKKYSVKSSLTAHLSIKHKNRITLVERGIDLNANVFVYLNTETHPEREDRTLENDGDGEQNDLEINDTKDINTNMFVENVGLFFLKLQCKYHIPVSTVQEICRELNNLHSVSSESFINYLDRRLSSEINEETKLAILSEVKNRDPFITALDTENGILRTIYHRKLFFKDRFKYIEPISIYLGRGNNDFVCQYHYVPIKETISNIFRDQSVFRCLLENTEKNTTFFQDYKDGSSYNTQFFQSDINNKLELILYQDSFKIVNPLGSAKKLHKMLAVYLCIGNLPSHIRMSLDNIQLVLLCRENDFNYFGHKQIFEKLLADLKDIEESGIFIQNNTFKGTIISILGDNLGSHILGGFTSNFSTANYVCRYCLCTRQNLYRMPLNVELRTNENYLSAVDMLERNENLNDHMGIKFNSCFNSLHYFNVCQPGLPPCLAHDLFEGIVQYDLALAIKYFVKQKWFMYCQLNKIIKQFVYLGCDSNDRPTHVNENGNKIGSHAVQCWCLLRLLPLMLASFLPEMSDPVWELVLLFRHIVELICASKISHVQVAYLNRLIEDYICDRQELFPDEPLKPKHHYLSHYPWLIYEFGPLINLWTMRMESKHTFFKRAARSAQNYKNVTKTLSEAHQLYQALTLTTSIDLLSVELQGATVTFDDELFSYDVARAIYASNLLTKPYQCSFSIKIKGSLYKKDLYVVCERKESALYFGKILLCITDAKNTPAFVISSLKGEWNNKLGAYELPVSLSDTNVRVCLYDSLLEYHPLPCYCVTGKNIIPLKCAIIDFAN